MHILAVGKCSPRILVSGDIWFVQLFIGVPWRGNVKQDCVALYSLAISDLSSYSLTQFAR